MLKLWVTMVEKKTLRCVEQSTAAIGIAMEQRGLKELVELIQKQLESGFGMNIMCVCFVCLCLLMWVIVLVS